MKRIFILFFIIVLASCGNKDVITTTTNQTTNQTTNKTESNAVLYVGDEYDFAYKNYQLSNDNIIIRNKKIIAKKPGQTKLECIIDNEKYIVILDIYEDDLQEFEEFIYEYQMKEDYSFMVYGGYSGYSYKRSRDDFYFMMEDQDIIEALIKTKTKARPGTKRKIEWIVIHDTGNISKTADAKNHSNYITNLAIQNNTSLSWHYTVDQSSIYQHIPDDEIAWHAGDGTKDIGANGYYLGGGNKNGIGIEMCVNQGNDIILTMKKCASLAVDLCLEYDLSLDRIKTHSDFAKKLCPYTVLYNNLWDDFMMMVQSEYLRKTKFIDFTIKEVSGGYEIKNLNSKRTKTIKIEA